MTFQRNALLSQPQLQGLAFHPRIDEVETASLISLDRLLRFLSGSNVQALEPSDIEAFCRLGKVDAAELRRLLKAVRILDPQSAAIESLAQAIASVSNQQSFRAFSHGILRKYSKSVSLPITELPLEWQEAFKEMSAGHAGATLFPRRGKPGADVTFHGHPLDL